MPLTSLQCPKCGDDLPDASRGTFTLYGIHADYLCPHCETVLRWERPIPLSQQWLLILATLPFIGFGAYGLWNLWNGITPKGEIPRLLRLPFLLSSLIYLIVTVMRFRDPWMLVVKHDIREKIWEIEAAELKLRSKPGSKW